MLVHKLQYLLLSYYEMTYGAWLVTPQNTVGSQLNSLYLWKYDDFHSPDTSCNKPIKSFDSREFIAQILILIAGIAEFLMDVRLGRRVINAHKYSVLHLKWND